MLSFLIRRALPVLVLGGITLSSCVVHEHDRYYGHRRGYGHDRGHGGYGYRDDRGRY